MSQNSSQADRYRVIINSIGAATPSSAAAVAKGLGISAADVIRCLYRAPAVLVDDVNREIAFNLHSLLEGIGYEVDVAANSAPAPAPPKLFEIAIYLKSAELFTQACDKLASFVGMPADDASKLLLTAPGTVLGSVSQATVDAFIQHMDRTVDVVVCPQNEGLFSLFLAECPPMVAQRLQQDLRKAGVELIDSKGLIAADISYEQIAELWQRHRANAQLRIINQTFLRYDLTLVTPPSVPLTDEQRECLLMCTEIPEALLETVTQSAPIALIDSVPHANMLRIMQQLHGVGLQVRADLITFQILGLKVHAAPQRALVNQLLQQFGVPPLSASLPANVQQNFPEIQARVIQNALMQVGAEVELIVP